MTTRKKIEFKSHYDFKLDSQSCTQMFNELPDSDKILILDYEVCGKDIGEQLERYYKIRDEYFNALLEESVMILTMPWLQDWAIDNISLVICEKSSVITVYMLNSIFADFQISKYREKAEELIDKLFNSRDELTVIDHAESYGLAEKGILSIDVMKGYSGIWECYTFGNK